MAISLEGQRAAVFGASSGIGLACVRRLAAIGTQVEAVARSEERLRERVGGVPGVRLCALDARDDATLAKFFGTAGPLDHVIVSLVSGAYFGPFGGLTPEAFRRSLEGKLLPYVNIAREALGNFRDGGTITWVTGLAARRATSSGAALAAINGALEGMLPTLAAELAPVRINAVSPGPTDTEAWDRLSPELRRVLADEAAATTPLGRIGTADDVADAVLAVMTSPFLTGVVIPCDGGRHLA